MAELERGKYLTCQNFKINTVLYSYFFFRINEKNRENTEKNQTKKRKDKIPDGKVNSPDVRGKNLERKGKSPDVKGKNLDGKGKHPDVKGKDLG